MQERTRRNLLLGVGIVFVVLIGAWWYSGFSLDFMRFFAAEPVAGPDIVQCSPATQTVTTGSAASLTASGGGGAYTWFAPEGSPVTGQGTAFSVTYATAGTKKVTVQAQRAGNAGYVDSVPCTVVVTVP